jgi:beta-glucanase (GH16 family)
LALSSSLLVGPGQVAAAAPAVVPAAAPVSPVPPAVDAKSSLSINPVADGGGIVATFSKAYRLKNRPVTLQVSTNSGLTWAPVNKVKMTSKGVATFKVGINDTASYRAVADAYKSKKTAVATKLASSKWLLDRTYQFTTGAALNTEWQPRMEGRYTALGRKCSAPYASNAVIGGDYASLSLTKEKNAAIIKSQLSDCTKSINGTKSFSSKTKKKLLKSVPLYRNAMVSTENRYSVRTGIVAARVKFPKNRGMHAGVWLQSNSRSEIDMIESYGYGKGITNVVHVNGKENKVYKKNTKSSWWKGYHVFSVEWTTTRVIFRMDGKVTKSVAKTTPGTDYFLVMSLLSSDWELDKLTSPSAKMSVDWVKVWKTK